MDDIAPHLPLSGYLFLAVLGIGYFLFQHALLHVVIKCFYPDYVKLNDHDRTDYRMQWNALFHGFISAIWSLYTILYTCGDGKTYMNSQDCREVARNSHVWLLAFTSGYLTLEIFFILVYMGIQTPLDKQTMTHHVLAALNFYLAFWYLGFPLVIGAVFVILEISTPFVCIRWLLFHHGKKGSVWQNINTLTLAFFFIGGRIFFQSYIIIAFVFDWLYKFYFEEENVPILYKIFVTEMLFTVFVNVLLNFYWSWLIIK